MTKTQNAGNELKVDFMSQLAKAEREDMSKRIKQGLAEAKRTRAVIYARKSTDSAAQQEESIAGQTAILMDLAKKYDLKVVGSFNDFGSTRAFQRPVLSGMIQAVRRGNVGNILCVSLDRISRSDPEMKKITDFLEKKGVKIVTP